MLQALKPGGYVLLTMKQGEGTSTAGGGQGPSGVRALVGPGFARGFRGDGACGGGGVYQCVGFGIGGDVVGVCARELT